MFVQYSFVLQRREPVMVTARSFELTPSLITGLGLATMAAVSFIVLFG